jgi:hypothetical protein
MTKTIPASAPMFSPSHIDRGSSTPANSRAPNIMTMLKPITPRTGFGNPKSDACSVLMTEPQESTGLMSQLGTKSGLLSTAIF